MAESVQLRLEEMRQELEQYSKFQIFTSQEIRNIAIQRKELEYKLHKHSKNKDDFLKYVQYEVDVLKLLRLKLKNYKCVENGVQVKKELFRYVINRIMTLFFYAVSRFPEDIKLWLTFIKFCKTERKFSEVSKNLERMLKYHGDKEQMWKIAARWEYVECGNIETARGFLLTGMKHHPQSELIHAEAIWLELKYADNLRKEAVMEAKKKGKEPNLEANVVMKGGLAHVMYESALEKLNSCSFLCQVLKIALDFEFSHELQESAKNRLTGDYPEEPETWIWIARLELESFTYEGERKVGLLYKRKRNKVIAPSKNQIIYASDCLFKAAQELNTEQMWMSYVDVLLELLENFEVQKGPRCYPNLVRRLLKEALEAAHLQAKLSAQLYQHYVDFLGDDLDVIEEVLSVATDRHPKALHLWIARLKLSFAKDNKVKSQKIFTSAVKLFENSDEVLELWLVMTKQFSNDKKLLDSLFELALPVKSNASEKIKVMHLEHVLASRGLAGCRVLYKKLSITPPFSLDLHRRMVALELQQLKVDVKLTRSSYEMMCDQFGSTNFDVWMEYVQFEMKHGSKSLVAGLYSRATKALNSAESEKFVQGYGKMTTS